MRSAVKEKPCCSAVVFVYHSAVCGRVLSLDRKYADDRSDTAGWHYFVGGVCYGRGGFFQSVCKQLSVYGRLCPGTGIRSEYAGSGRSGSGSGRKNSRSADGSVCGGTCIRSAGGNGCRSAVGIHGKDRRRVFSDRRSQHSGSGTGVWCGGGVSRKRCRPGKPGSAGRSGFSGPAGAVRKHQLYDTISEKGNGSGGTVGPHAYAVCGRSSEVAVGIG